MNYMKRDLDFIVTNQRIEKDRDCDFSGIFSGTKGYLRCRFSFSREWEGLSKAAIFKCGNSVRYAPIVNNECMIPNELTDFLRIKIAVAGKSPELTLTTNSATIIQQEGALNA